MAEITSAVTCRVGNRGDEQPERQCQGEVEQRQAHDSRDTARHGHVQYETGQQQDGDQIQTRQREVGDHLGEDDPDRPHGRDEQHFHRAGLLLAHDRHGGHDRADDDEDPTP